MTKTERKRNLYLKIKFPALWLAINVHRTHKNRPITFNRRHYLKALYLDTSDDITVKKSTQCGVSEWLWLDTVGKAMEGRSVFYVLPTIILKNQFVRDRVDTSISFTPAYKQMIKMGEKSSESMSLKHISRGGVAFVGSNSKASFTSYAADDFTIDELDECDKTNISMAPERISNSEYQHKIKVANPTIEEFGIDEEYNDTDKKEWHIKCSSCGKYIHPDFFKHVLKKEGEDYIIIDPDWDRDSEQDIKPICNLCGRPFDRFVDGEWIPEQKHKRSGYHISKMFSTNVTIVNLLGRFEAGLVDDTQLQRFWNGDLGLAFTASGARVDRLMILDATQDYRMESLTPKVCVMGIDVGNFLHVRINEITENIARAVYIGKVKTYSDIRELYYKYHVRVGIVDAQPEERLASKICTLRGMWRCFYGSVKKDVYDVRGKILTVNRTKSLDGVKESLMLKTLVLPSSVMHNQEYLNHMQALTRISKVRPDGSYEYVWMGSKPDHYFHAENYAKLARKLFVMASRR
jgi:hypothetical protein